MKSEETNVTVDAEILRSELDRAWREVDFIAKERTEHLEWRTKLANDLDECERMRDVLARTVNVLDAENKELRSAETVAWMICEPECKYGPTFGTENAAWSALTKAPPGSELVELVRRGK